MLVYYSVLGVLCLDMLMRTGIKEKTGIGTKYNVGAALSAILLTLVSGLRYMVGTDYPTYVINYELYLHRPLSIFEQPALGIVARISSWIYDDYATWFFIMALITVLPIMYRIFKDNMNPAFSVVLFLFLGCWHGSFNLVKQSAAMAILFLGYKSLVNRKFWRWLIFCLIASMFHITALFMIPVYFLIAPKITVYRTSTLILIGVLILVLYEPLFDMMEFLKQGEGTTGINSSVGSRSVSVLRILVNIAPIAFALAFWKLYDKNDKRFALLFNMSLFNAIINISSISSVYLNRFCTYTNIFNILFIPYLVKPFKSRTKFLITTLVCVLYFAFWSYDIYKGSTIRVYQWIFNR